MTIDEKYLNAVHYIINTCESTEALGITKLNNILLFIDGFLYRKNGATLTGDTYIKRKRGLTPKNIFKVKNALIKQERISVRKDTKPHSFCSKQKPDLSMFSEVEIDAMYTTASYISSNYTVKEIAEISRTKYWESSELGKEIDLGAYFGGKKSKSKAKAKNAAKALKADKSAKTSKASKSAKAVKVSKIKTKTKTVAKSKKSAAEMVAIKDTDGLKSTGYKRTHR